MFILKTLILCAAYLAINCQHQGPTTTTPVPILKQINKQNDDGSYSFGYEAADGSFKIETKYPNGDVAGKYGYVDANGKTREISYGASSKRGFEPQGTGIQVPPPTLHNDSPASALADGQEDDGQYREDPSIYEDPKYNGRASSKANRQYHQYSVQATEAPQYEPQYQPKSAPSQFRSSPLYSQQTSLFKQSPQQFPNEDYRPQSQVYHQQPEFSYQGYTSQPSQNYQSNYQSQPAYQSQYQSQPAFQSQYQSQPTYQARQAYQPQTASYQNQNFNPFFGHPATNFDPSTGSYTINFTG